MSKIWIESDFPHPQRILGLDEAGRGPLAGPCVVAGVILPKGFDSALIFDSKQLSVRKRQLAFDEILTYAHWIMIVSVMPETIDRINIYRATQQAMQFIAEHAQADLVLTDAMPFKLKHIPVLDYVKGDQKSISIAAASILAKVTRDEIMSMYDQMYPQYGFKQHKGYPTKVHLEALNRWGICPIHRKSYQPVSKTAQTQLF
jgi:ribonuclease HII